MSDVNYEYSDYSCDICGRIENYLVNEHEIIDHVPYGDQSVPMYSYVYSCNTCGSQVERNEQHDGIPDN